MTIRANCKINIGLDILRRREDKFHDLSTIMYPVKALYDEVTIEPLTTPNMEFISLGLDLDCPAEKNLCVRAALLMQSRYATPGVRIILNKMVPFGAGLGGGSSDATAVIVAMNKIFDLSLSEEDLISIASELGSDTAFFVRNSPQLCTGRGEIMQPLNLDLSSYSIVMIKPNVGISTSLAYSSVHPKAPNTPLQELINQPIECWQGSIKNDFEPHIFEAYPILAQIKQGLLDSGAIYASMSGSGSTIYGIFDPSVANYLDSSYIVRYNPYLLKL